MLPYFAATGHNNYTKCVQLYLQDMQYLKENNTTLYEMFMFGLFFIRRSDRYWGGLPKDLVIELTLMRSMKSTGGLISGKRGGIDEKHRSRWLMSLPMCSAVHEAMQSFTDTTLSTS